MVDHTELQKIHEKNNREWRQYLVERFDRLEDGTLKRVGKIEQTQSDMDDKINKIDKRIVVITTVASCLVFIINFFKGSL